MFEIGELAQFRLRNGIKIKGSILAIPERTEPGINLAAAIHLDLCDRPGQPLRDRVLFQPLPNLRDGFIPFRVNVDAEALDLRCIRLRSADRELFEKIVGVPYTEVVRGPEQQPVFDSSTLPAGADIRLLSLQLSEALRKRGRLLYLPEYPEKWERL